MLIRACASPLWGRGCPTLLNKYNVCSFLISTVSLSSTPHSLLLYSLRVHSPLLLLDPSILRPRPLLSHLLLLLHLLVHVPPLPEDPVQENSRQTSSSQGRKMQPQSPTSSLFRFRITMMVSHIVRFLLAVVFQYVILFHQLDSGTPLSWVL